MTFPRLLVATGLVTSLALGLAFARPAAEKARPDAASGASTLEVDPVHSTALFKIKHAGAAWFHGRFNTLAGTIQYDAEAPEKSKVEFTIDVATVDTNNTKRDDHLRSPDFFDAGQFPKATFRSTKVEKKGATLAVTGDLALHGVTKSVTAEVEHVGDGKGPRGTDVSGFSATLVLQRGEFGIKTLPGMLGEEVTLTIDVEAGRK